MPFTSFDISLVREAERLRSTFSPLERWVFAGLSALLILATLGLMQSAYLATTRVVPASGGSVSEGVVGAPRFVNPVLALSQTDKDLTKLVYAGLLTIDESGSLVPELAESYEVSEDARTYTFRLKDDLTFHDGSPLTADDVAFTVSKALDPAVKSPERANWEGVTVTVVDPQTITFTLSKPYAQFIQNATLGILPQVHWGQLSADEFVFSQLNAEPIGAGPFTFVSATHSSSGIPESMQLSRFSDYARGAPYLKNITFHFYHNQDELLAALQAGRIDMASELSAQAVDELPSQYRLVTTTLPRIFAVFFNPGHNDGLKSKTVRATLRDMIDTDAIVRDILGGHAYTLNTPLLLSTSDSPTRHKVLSVEEAREALGEAGYDEDTPLTFTLATANTEELKAVATAIADRWTAAGVQVKMQVFEPGDLSQTVLRTRDYDALLFGEVVGTVPDPYAFWHSSQIRDPGLNLALYADSTVDKLLVQARNAVDAEERAEIYSKISARIVGDAPALFLYAPDFMYVVNNRVKGVVFPAVMEPHERFASAYLWHINTTHMWDVFAN